MEVIRLKKVTLGRGLDALIPVEKDDNGYILVSVDQLKPNPFQPRQEFDEISLNELSASISENGIIQPLIVRKTEMGYEIIAGERRWRAAQKIGLNLVPVILKKATDREILQLALIENLQREDLNPLEEALAYEQLIGDFGLTHDEISKRIGKERSTITNQIRLLKLPDSVKEALRRGNITAGHARALLSIESPNEANELLQSIINQKLSVRQTERLVQNLYRLKDQKRKTNDIDYHLDYITDELKKAFGTQIRIIDKKGKGKIEIEYYSKEELERIIEILSSKR